MHVRKLKRQAVKFSASIRLIIVVRRFIGIFQRRRLVKYSLKLEIFVQELSFFSQDKSYNKSCKRISQLATLRIAQGVMSLNREEINVGVQALKRIELFLINNNINDALYELHKAQLILGQYGDVKTRLAYILGPLNKLDIYQLPEMIFEVGMDKELDRLAVFRGVNYRVFEKVLLDDVASDSFVYIDKLEECSVLPYVCIKKGKIVDVVAKSFSRSIVPSIKLVENAVVDDTFSIFVGNESEMKFVVYEKCADPSRGFSAGLMDKYFGSPSRLTHVLGRVGGGAADIKLDSAIHIIGRVPRNLFHLLIEYIPRYSIVIRSGLIKKNIPILVPGEIPYQLFKIMKVFFGTDVELIQIGRNEKVGVGKLYVPSFGSELDDTTHVDMVRCGLYSPSFIRYLRNGLKKINIDDISVPEKVYLARPGNLARGLLNGGEVKAYLEKQGFEVVDPSRLSIEQQVAIFSKSKVIVGVAGAAFSWVFMAGAHSKIISFVADGNETYSIQQELASSSGAKHMFVCGARLVDKELYESRLHYFHASFNVSLNDLEFALSN